MQEMVKALANGQWTMDETLEKAKIYDIKSKKKIADLPSPDVGKRPKLGLKGALSKPVRQPIAGSPAAYENKPTKEGTAKEKKYQGGDPRHVERFSVNEGMRSTAVRPTRAGAKREHVFGSPRSITSGVSELRYKTAPQHTEYTRETAPERSTGKPVKWNKSEEEAPSLVKAFPNGQWTMDETLEKGQARKQRRAEERGAKETAMKKVPVHGISHATAVAGHGYDVTHHDLRTGKTTTERKAIGETGIRQKDPNRTHKIHLPAPYQPVHVSKDTADKIKEKGHFNMHSYLAGGSGLED